MAEFKKLWHVCVLMTMLLVNKSDVVSLVFNVQFTQGTFLQVFYRFHIVCFIGFLVFGNLHVPGFTSFVPAALLLYAVDVVLRVVQQSAPVSVKTSLIADGSVAMLSVGASKVSCKATIFCLLISSSFQICMMWRRYCNASML